MSTTASIDSRSRHIFRLSSILDDNNGPSSTWVTYLAQLNQLLSGCLPHLCFRLTDIILLFLGLYNGSNSCSISSSLSVISILLLVFSGIDFTIVLFFLIRNVVTRNVTLSDEEKRKQFQLAVRRRLVILFIKLVITCVGTGYVFKSIVPSNTDCEITRFYLGIVCFRTWALFCMRIPKPALPERRLLLIKEYIKFSLTITFNCVYFGLVGFVTTKIQDAACLYTNIEDLYYRAPLKCFAYVGLILIACKTVLDIFNFVINLLYFRLHNWQTVLVRLLAAHYVLFYLINLFIIYYLSVGAVLLFQSRSGASCRLVAPKLYKTLLIWQWIRMFSSFAVFPLVLLLLCIGREFAKLASYCLPPSISIPLLETVLEQIPQVMPDNPGSNTLTPSATLGENDISALLVFGQESDPFNQIEW